MTLRSSWSATRCWRPSPRTTNRAASRKCASWCVVGDSWNMPFFGGEEGAGWKRRVNVSIYLEGLVEAAGWKRRVKMLEGVGLSVWAGGRRGVCVA
eukprot:261367-Chlamydomonas_euryale.AAC.1